MSLGVVVWGGARRRVMHLNLISGIPPLFELHRLVLFVRCVLSDVIIFIIVLIFVKVFSAATKILLKWILKLLDLLPSAGQYSTGSDVFFSLCILCVDVR